MDYFPPGMKWLLISNTAIFLLIYLGGRDCSAAHHARCSRFTAAAAVQNLYVWQLFTYMFLHGGIWHLLFNMLTLWMFGTQLERDWGTRRFLKYYFYCGIAAGVCVLVVNCCWATGHAHARRFRRHFRSAAGLRRLYPNQTVLMNFLFPIKAKYLVMIYAAIELLLDLRAQHRRQHDRAPGRHGVRVSCT